MENAKDLTYILKKNGLIWGFQGGSASIINNFLHDTTDETTKQKYSNFDINQVLGEMLNFDIDQALDEMLNHDKSKIFKFKTQSKVLTDPVLYFPITKDFIEDIIEIDEVFRASKLWNSPITLYRGAPPVNKNALNGVVSTSLDQTVAMEFYKGALIKINLPKGSPYIKLEGIGDPVFDNEKEVILPPCDFEITKTFTLPHADFPKEFPEYYKCYEVSVIPKNLSECVLDRMKHPPKDYFDYFTENDKLNFKEAQRVLDSYVKEYVKNDKFKLLSELISQSELS